MESEVENQDVSFEAEGQSMGAVGAIIGLIVGVGVATLVLIFVGVLGGQTYQLSEAKLDEIGNNVVIDDSFTAHNSSAQSLAHGFIQQGTLSVSNTTIDIGLGNFTIDYDAGTILLNGAEHNGSTLYANYTWGASEVREYAKSGIISSFSALKQTGDYLPVVVLAVIIALVLALVLGFTSFGSRNSGGSAL